MKRGVVRVRRAPHLVIYWRGGELVVHNYATGRLSPATIDICEALDFCGEWRSAAALAARLQIGRALAEQFVARMVDHGLFVRADKPIAAGHAAMRALDPWNPAAGLFHDASRRVRFLSPAAAARFMRQRAREAPAPPPVKRVRGVRRIQLPTSRPAGEFPEVLLARRTWRRFSPRPVPIEQLSTTLALSAGVQHWVATPFGRVPLKTSPSGGARHPVELYVCALRVSGLAPGLYHYASDVHALERVRRGNFTTRVREWMPHSTSFGRAAFIVIFTAVLERELWRYPYARAYRAALTEAGHVCQTFCLTATWLGLAPFCLMGLDDAAIERDLGLDGVRETVLYAAGAGARPRGTAWAPRRRGSLDWAPNPAFTDL